MNLNQRPTRQFDETYGDRVKEKEAKLLLNDYVDEDEGPFDNALEEYSRDASRHQPLPSRSVRSADMESLTMSNSSREPRRKALPVRTWQQVLMVLGWCNDG